VVAGAVLCLATIVTLELSFGQIPYGAIAVIGFGGWFGASRTDGADAPPAHTSRDGWRGKARVARLLYLFWTGFGLLLPAVLRHLIVEPSDANDTLAMLGSTSPVCCALLVSAIVVVRWSKQAAPGARGATTSDRAPETR
jgi:hypothetical protein